MTVPQTSEHQNIVAPLPPEPGATVAALPHSCAPAPAGDVAGTPAEGAPATPRPRARLIGIDAARGIALVGMMSVHLIPAATDDGDVSLAWLLSNGKASALFALLAGVGIAFSTGRRRPPRGLAWRAGALSLLTRAVIIAAIGLALGYVVGTGDAAVILAYYGVLFALAIPFLRLSTRGLVVAAALAALVMPLVSYGLRLELTPVAVANPTLTDLVTDPLGLLLQLTLTGVFPALVWIAYLLAGMAVGRAVLASRRVVSQITLLGLALALASSLLSMLLLTVGGRGDLLRADAVQTMDFELYQETLTWGPSGTTPTNSPWWLVATAPHSGSPLDLAFTIGVALAVLGGCLLLGRGLQPLLRPLAAGGSMTLTLYSVHLLLVAAPIPRGVLNLVVQVVLLLTFALVWNRSHLRGPLEELVWRATDAVRRKVLGSPGAHRAPATTAGS
ncbi:heparan-alpha-glucosaminide N-acetyltransferase domain-containing protein [Modestobacter sp. VKM Ac-2984]|uniref:heparan-alpha-glucosaminide N-acetyltransferase domain-containing protein n=1 Tax=Modestobacter sp. VKM Ac-2984 TaxID=3004138 RepID=UPI0022AA72A8|nr:heparan-alpha-glucosaminide N-acetyltransferase domain-containing protein [Modestobacter sp. VKM Ac-2984]MCZ2818559.1 heparan-alpha-glucosaminide N-acetyltransferase domain-containing protein [Modestobacter sp. VKM Ac-2984]